MSHAPVALTSCPNCGRDLDGAFCAACGQKVAALNPTFHDLLHDLVHELLHVDGKIFQSVRLLLTRPGFLSREYFEGRRTRYVSPVRLYLVFSVLFFLVAAGVEKPLTAEDRAELARAEGPLGRKANPEFIHTVEAWMPRTMFLLVPVLGLWTAAATRSVRRHYPLHLYFAFHVQAGLFAVGAAWMLLRWGDSEAMDVIADVTAVVLAASYLVVAFRTAYGGTWGRAAARAAFVGIAYFLSYAVALAALVGLALFVA
jgi:hypothetical protein